MTEDGQQVSTLTQLLQVQAATQPQGIALIEKTRQLSYGELWQQVSEAAEGLRTLSIEKGDRVLLLLDNSGDYVACYYAIMALGAVVVPLNTALKGEQLLAIVRHAEPSLLIHDGERAEFSALGADVRLQPVSDIRRSAASLRREDLFQPDDANALAAIAYTSGTTGRPKGVMLSVGNLVSNTRAIVHYLALDARDRVMCVLPFYYAYGNSVLHSHLAVGASLVLENSLMYPQLILQRMEALQVTGFSGVPSTYRLLLQRCELSSFPLPTLRYLTQAGGALAPEDVERLCACWPAARFFVMYGQTEATARLTWLPPDCFADKAGSVGLPIPGTRIGIFDEKGQEKPRGEYGEICAAGPGIMLGYWRDPEASRRRFFGEWLRTGDLGWQDEEGFVTVIGRRSDMIKTGDHRIAPEEIEQLIGSMDEVEEVAVVGVPDKLLGQVIEAHVVLKNGSQLEAMKILRHCRERCAAYKVPRRIHFIASLPRTASGKVQRYKLSESLFE